MKDTYLAELTGPPGSGGLFAAEALAERYWVSHW